MKAAFSSDCEARQVLALSFSLQNWLIPKLSILESNESKDLQEISQQSVMFFTNRKGGAASLLEMPCCPAGVNGKVPRDIYVDWFLSSNFTHNSRLNPSF